jgi:hypothetical protein
VSFNQAIYDEAIAKGASPLFADMLAHQRPPGTKGTDRTFLEGRQCQEDIRDMPPLIANQWKRMLKKKGVSAAGKVYCSALARKHNEVGPGEYWGSGDPYAFVSDLGEAKAKALALGRDISGCIDVKAPERPPKPDTPLANDIIARKAQELANANPGRKFKDVVELREAIIEKHSPKWGKGASYNYRTQMKEKSHVKAR